MSHGRLRPALVTGALLALLCGCGKGDPFFADVARIEFATTVVPPADAGRLYNTVIQFTAGGGAALPDRFEIAQGVLPTGVSLERDRADLDFDGLPDQGSAYTGNARLLGTPREKGSFRFTLKAISTGTLNGVAQGGGQPALATQLEFTVNVGEGAIAILNPTAAEGTKDPQVPAFPEVVPFVNPANPKAFFSFSFLVAGGSGNNRMSIFVPRELELSAFDQAVVTSSDPNALRLDTDENVTGGATGPFEADINDGGWFILQGGNKRVQVGGFQAPRGPVRTDTDDDGVQDTDFMLTLLDQWFQDPACPLNSRRDFGDTLGLGLSDPTVGPAAIAFCDYFAAAYRDTDGTVPNADRAKYAFKRDQYINAFFVAFGSGDLTPLKYNLIVQAVDTRGTIAKTDDVIARKSYIVQVQIPDIVIDTVFLDGGQAGVDYNKFVNASGGVPPLSFELEWVDSTADLAPTFTSPLTKSLFGVELEPRTGQFIGAPRAAAPDTNPATPTADGPVVELTVRVYADVMNPTQNGSARIPTGTAGEFDGTGPDPDGPGPLTGKPGRHKTFPVNFALPTVPVVANTALVPGIDGVGYPGDRVAGSGGVPLLAPYPVGFFVTSPGGTYPSATARRAYDWDSRYVLDESHPDPTLALGNKGDTVNGLPHNLSLVKSASVATNGNITGTPFDRGFHPVTILGQDFYVGNMAVGPADPVAFRTTFQKTLALSISPDSGLYMRGVQTSEASGGEATGLLEAATQAGEARMVPMMLAAGIYGVETGKSPVLFNPASPSVPKQIDLLPVMLPNGGSDAHNRKSIPSISGFWPAESGNDVRWLQNGYYGDSGWAHLQQETCWLQSPDPTHARVFAWAETELKTFNSGAWTQKYQQLKVSGKRGLLVVKPLTGEFHMPAVLDGSVSDHGQTFGAEAVIASTGNSGTSSYAPYDGGYYRKYYLYTVQDTRHDRELHMHGAGSYIEQNGTSTSTSQGWYKTPMGRSATSIAMSADGLWCATALPGGTNTQKLLIWRTDKRPMTDFFAAASHLTFVNGANSDGTTLPNHAVIYRPAQAASSAGIPMNVHQRYLLPDSLMFVENGILFLNETNLDRVYGISLVDGHISSKALNGAPRTTVNGAGTGITVNSNRGQLVPDQDYVRGFSGEPCYAAQFAFAGDKPDPDEEGPDSVAFIAGDTMVSTYSLAVMADLTSNHPRQGYGQIANAPRSLLFLDLNTTTGGLDLGASTLRDLTGSDNRITGDLLTPGRSGEELDFLAVSDDGRYAALVRDFSILDSPQSTFGYRSTFHSPFYYYSGYDAWVADHDLMVLSTDGSDMHSGGGSEHILYLGTQSASAGAGNPTLPSYAIGRAYLNAAFRRINGLHFAPDGRTLIFNYSGDDSYNPTHGIVTSTGWGPINPETTGTFGFGVQLSVRLHFRTTSGGAIDFADGNNVKNNLQGLTGVGSIGPTSANFGASGSSQLFWATFKSADGNFLYYISDQIDSSTAPNATNRNYMVGFNITASPINGRQPYVPFTTHPNTIGFEQFDCNSFNYEQRFAAAPGGVSLNGKDASGILCVIASDASAGPGRSTDLEVYVMDANRGTSLIALTSAVTTGTNNALNYLYLSADGNVLAGHRTATATTSFNSRSHLTGTSDLFAVTNIHAVLGGAAPVAFVVSAGKSHGSSVAFVGDGTPAGPQAVIFSAATAGGNDTWDDRTLQVGILSAGGAATTLDNTSSHYVVLSGGRKLNDVPTTSN